MWHGKKKTYIAAAILLVVTALATVIVVKSAFQIGTTPTVYVGVTYGGNSVAEAKQLIDKVKGYSNLFALQSGDLQRDFKAVDEIGDYAIDAGMYFLPYFGNYVEATFSAWLDSAKQRWGTKLLGIYHSDDLGGKMLDDYSKFTDVETGNTIGKTRYGDIVVEKPNGVVIHYELNGEINLLEPTQEHPDGVYSTYYPNGSVTVKQSNVKPSTSYQQLANQRPFRDQNETAARFISRNQQDIGNLKNSTTVFSSDYALYWFDYKSGYDVMLTQLGWNISLNQQIALCRGAATAQGKDWGVIVTWKYNSPHYLDSGSEVFNQLKTSYEAGAKYFLLFNFYEEGTSNPYGTLGEEHFQALENFWNNVVNNSGVVHGSVEADSVLVLPQNFGGGLRWRTDIVWGVFKPDETSGQLWDLLQQSLNAHGLKLDVAFEDLDNPVSGKYSNIIHFSD